MLTASTLNAPNWVDLTTPDVDRAVGFYSRLLGWDVEIVATPVGKYHVATVGDREVAGLMAEAAEDAEGRPAWTLFVNVEDVDEMPGRIEAAGGEVLAKPFDIPGGRVAVVADPTGAMFAVIHNPAMATDRQWFGIAQGMVCWVELLSRERDRAERFYADVFGWRPDVQHHDDTSHTTFTLEGYPVAGLLAMPTEVPATVPSHWSTYFAVEDCCAIERRAVELGGCVLRPSTEVGLSMFAVLEDPDGAKFCVMENAG